MQLEEYICSKSLSISDDLEGTCKVTSSSNDFVGENRIFLHKNDNVFILDKGGQVIIGTYSKISHDFKYIFINDIQYRINDLVLIGPLV